MWIGVRRRYITPITIVIRITADSTIRIRRCRFHLGLGTTTIMAVIIMEAATTAAIITEAAIMEALTGAALPWATFMRVVPGWVVSVEVEHSPVIIGKDSACRRNIVAFLLLKDF